MRIRRLITICLAVAVASMCFTSLASATDPGGGWTDPGGGWTDPPGGGWTDPPGGGWTDPPGGWTDPPGGGWQNLNNAQGHVLPKSDSGKGGLALAAIGGGLTLLVGGTAVARRRRRENMPAGLAA